MIASRRLFLSVRCSSTNSCNSTVYNRRSKHTDSKNNSPKWEGVVGLEVHAQINTVSKLFSGASTSFGSFANDNVALFDAAAPGTLPVLNKKAVEMGLTTALALTCQINPVSFFDRKHYFYADLPAGYQITQQRYPLAFDGSIEFPVWAQSKKKFYSTKSKLKQIQLEQDSGKSLHDDYSNKSLIDLNRAGIPLMELVFEPDLSDGEEAAALVKELCLILTKIQTCTCRMEEGALRVDANISVRQEGRPLGTRTEVKNLGSVRAVANAVDFEIKRQIDKLSNGGSIDNETRGWDAIASQTVPMRDKEVKLDYRFMPEPNLPPLRVNLGDVASLKNSLPELPRETRNRLMNDYGLSQVFTNNLVSEEILLGLFADIVNSKEEGVAKIAAKILTIELMTLVNKNLTSLDDPRWNRNTIGEIVYQLQDEKINLTTAQALMVEIANGNTASPKEIIAKLGLTQISDEKVIEDLCRQVIDSNPNIVNQYLNGKGKVFNAFLGLVAQKSGNRVNMKLAAQILKRLLSEKE